MTKFETDSTASDGMQFLAEFQARIEAEAKEFFEAVGRAMGTWSRVENQLYETFLLSVGLPEAHFTSAAAAFYSVISFQARLEMTDCAFRLSFGGSEFEAEWLKLVEIIRTKAKHRNEIAHYVPVQDHQEKAGRIWHLRANVYDPNARLKGKRKLLYTSDLKTVEKQFALLSEGIGKFLIRIHHKHKTGPFAF